MSEGSNPNCNNCGRNLDTHIPLRGDSDYMMCDRELPHQAEVDEQMAEFAALFPGIEGELYR